MTENNNKKRKLKKEVKYFGSLVALIIVAVFIFIIVMDNNPKTVDSSAVASAGEQTEEGSQTQSEEQENDTSSSGDPKDILPTVADSESLTASTDNPNNYTGETPYQYKMNNPVIEGIEALPSDAIGCGNGPACDEYNRPYSALERQCIYRDYQVYYVRDDLYDNTIFLTFDDGFEYGPTPFILDTLKEKGVRAVFFVTLPYVRQNPELVWRMINEGHIVGNHSVRHKNMAELSIQEQEEEIMGLHNYMLENFGYEMWLFRYPGGDYSQQSLAVANNCGYASLLWSFAYTDYYVDNQPERGYALNHMLNKLHTGAIYLLHAESWTNSDVLGEFIDEARARGYKFELFYPVRQ